MNKQLVSFLSLFSLVLVLSIYYVMLPFKGSNDFTGNNGDLPIINEIEDPSESYFASLEIQKSESYKELLDAQKDILASASATIEEKVNKLIQKANNRGGTDNISVAYLIRNEEGEDKWLQRGKK